jgi:hypothetical protein
MRPQSPAPAWPTDPGHREAIETLLTMAEAEDRWGNARRAIHLLDHVERIVGQLPEPFERLRLRCSSPGGHPPIV